MIRKCLFPVAGYGTRFLPATKSMPKEMLPILDKPLVQYGVEEALEAGLNEIGFVTGRGKRAIEDHFDVSYELEHQIAGTGKEKALEGIRGLIDDCTFSYIRQVNMGGLGDAVQKGRPLVGDEAFGVVLADDLCLGANGGREPGVLRQMVGLYEQFSLQHRGDRGSPAGEHASLRGHCGGAHRRPPVPGHGHGREAEPERCAE